MLKKCKYIPRLETSRLILREISEKDTEDLRKWLGRDEIYTYQGRAASKGEKNPELLFIDPRPNVKRKPSSDFIWGLIRNDMVQKEQKMSERLSVLHHGKSICAFELVDAKGQYIEEIRHDIREASQAGELICPECGQKMILCAGAIIQPYFRHFKRQACRSTLELQTKAGRRKYFCRKALFQIVESAGKGWPGAFLWGFLPIDWRWKFCYNTNLHCGGDYGKGTFSPSF